MAKLAWNKFIDKHQVRICLFIAFPDYQSGRKLKGSGKLFPSPNDTLSAYIRSLSGDGALRGVPKLKGKGQHLMLSDADEAENLMKRLRCEAPRRGDGAPCAVEVACAMDDDEHLQLAQALGLV